MKTNDWLNEAYWSKVISRGGGTGIRTGFRIQLLRVRISPSVQKYWFTDVSRFNECKTVIEDDRWI